ncbi:MAG: hypothetical protein WDZ77_00570 [Candidatus Pacearchaeota archaeon]
MKRQKAPKNWPVKRKGTKYLIGPRFGIKNGIPLLVALRDILKIADNRREVKKAINAKNVVVNNKISYDERQGLLLFDKLKIVPLKKSYSVEIMENKKIGLREVNEKDSNFKVSKVIGKKILKKGKVQLNLSDGNNFFSDTGCKLNDSLLINLEKKSIEKCLPLKEGAKVFVFEGKHAGKRGKVFKIDSENKIVEIEVDKEKINVLIKQIIVEND